MNSRSLLLLGWVTIFPCSGVACTVSAVDVESKESKAPTSLSLTESERSRAVALAEEGRRDMEVAALPVEGAEITKEVVTAVALYPPTDETDDRRLAAVTSFDYRTGRAARVIVDLGAGEIVQARSLPGSAAPVGPDEVARLRELLAADSEAYRALLDAPADTYDLGTFVSVDEDGELAGHRVVLVRPVYFRSAPRAPIAIVDLTEDRVLRYEE